MYSLYLLLTIPLQLVATYINSLPTFLALLFYSCSLTETTTRKFQGFEKSRLVGYGKNCHFLRISKWQHKLVWQYKQGTLVSYFLNNAAETCSYRLKSSESNEIKHVFQSKAYYFGNYVTLRKDFDQKNRVVLHTK